MKVARKEGLRRAYARLMKDVEKAPGNACWLHKRQRRSYVYFYIRINEGGPKTVHAQRLIWWANNGPIPPGMMVCHTCDNPPCLRLSHYFLGTALDNMADAMAKGRNWSKAHRRHVSLVHTGMKHTEEAKRQMSATRTGKKLKPPSEATRQKISAALRGRKTPQEIRDKLSIAQKKTYEAGRVHHMLGKPNTPKQKAKISASLKGRVSPTKGMKFPNRPPVSDATRLKISIARLGKPKTPEQKAKISASLKGRVSPTKGMKFPNRPPMSDATRLKISIARKKLYANKP